MRFSLAITRLDRIRNEHTWGHHRWDTSVTEAKMVWTYPKEGLGYIFTWKRCWGYGTASRRKSGEGIVREYRGCWMTGEWV